MISGIQYHRLAFRDIDAERFKDVLDRANLEHTVMAAQSGHAVVEQFHGPNFSLDRGSYAFPVMARGHFAPGCLCIGMALGGNVPTWINGYSTGHGNFQVYTEGADLLYRAGPQGRWIGLTVSREKLQAEARKRLGRELRILRAGGMEHLRIDAAAYDRLTRLVRSMSPAVGTLSRDPADLEATLMGAYVEAFATADESTADRVRRRAAYRLDVVRRADAAMRQMIGSPYSSTKLCRFLGVSERSLELLFQEALAVRPKAWFQQRALQRARALLLRGSASVSWVTRVALDCGFQHLGRFSESYRKLFRELPSETLRCSLAGSSGIRPASH